MDQVVAKNFIASNIDGIGSIAIKRSLRRKHIGVKCTADGSFVLLAPQFASQRQLELALVKLRPWMEAQQHKVVQKRHLIHHFSFQPGAEFFFRGKKYPLQLQSDPRSNIIKFDGEKLLTPNADPVQIKNMLEAFYRRHIRILVTAILEYAAAKYDIKIGEISINGATGRFGSCSSDGSMNFSWHLAMYPDELIELVALHEFAHRSEMNHSAAFYRVLASYLPDHRERNRQLKEWTCRFSCYNSAAQCLTQQSAAYL